MKTKIMNCTNTIDSIGSNFNADSRHRFLTTKLKEMASKASHVEQNAMIVSHVPISIETRLNPRTVGESDSTISSKSTTDRIVGIGSDRDDDIRGAIFTQITRERKEDSLFESSLTSPQTPQESYASQTLKSNILHRGSATIQPNKRKARRISIDESAAIGAGPASPSKKVRLDTRLKSRTPSKTPAEGHLSVNNKSHVLSMMPTSTTLLSNPNDEEYLNPLHVLVRRNIEVFDATPIELAQPAPGRKHPIRLRQVGLRCIHCHRAPNRKRVKRAVCYPSSVSRVYHSVSDMKFDHFSNCPKLPPDIRSQFEKLKKDSKKAEKKGKKTSASLSSSTAQYYHDTAYQMGMRDDDQGGIFFANTTIHSSSSQQQQQQHAAAPSLLPATGKGLPHFGPDSSSLFGIATQDSLISFRKTRPVIMVATVPTTTNPHSCMPTLASVHPYTLTAQTMIAQSILPQSPFHASVERPLDNTSAYVERQGGIILGNLKDAKILNQLHCFVRQNVELFEATAQDIAAPAPGRKAKLSLGQVGIRCIHCARLPASNRVKRAVCYPPYVAGIYHSVSNMKFDHFGICKGLPEKDRDEFYRLKRSASRRGTKNRFNNGPVSAGMSVHSATGGSTAQYYCDSAFQLGLIDTDKGIRFGNDRSDQSSFEKKASSSDVEKLVPNDTAKANSPTTDRSTILCRDSHPDHLLLRMTRPTGMSALMMAAAQQGCADQGS